MDDSLAEHQEAMFDRAQAQYGAEEPPEAKRCGVCDGEGRVLVAAILDIDGNEVPWPKRYEGPEIDCPFCT